MNISFSRQDLDLDVEDPEPDTDSEEDDDETLIDLNQFDSDEELLIDENQPVSMRDTDDDDTSGRKQIKFWLIQIMLTDRKRMSHS